MMSTVSVLSRKIKTIDREGIEESYPLSVLRFICDTEIAGSIEDNPNRPVAFHASEIKINPYDGEIPFTLQSDAEIIINKKDNTISIK